MHHVYLCTTVKTVSDFFSLLIKSVMLNMVFVDSLAEDWLLIDLIQVTGLESISVLWNFKLDEHADFLTVFSGKNILMIWSKSYVLFLLSDLKGICVSVCLDTTKSVCFAENFHDQLLVKVQWSWEVPLESFIIRMSKEI